MKPIIVGKARGKYPILFSTTVDIAETVAALTTSSQNVVILADSNVHALYQKVISRTLSKVGKRATLLTLPSGERHKSGKHLLTLLESIISSGIDRSATIVAFGGGVTTDMAGCVASLLLRGVRWVAIPTTFLGMVDAAIGGKTGVNSAQGKNLIGTFWPPEAVIVAPDFIRTQPRTEFEDSIAEAVKYNAINTAIGAIGGRPSLTDLKLLQQSFPEHDAELSQKIMGQCARIKARIVGADEREDGVRAFLNFGHTIGHALEFCGSYRHISHGRAVAAGMVGAISLSEKAGLPMSAAVKELQEYCASLATGRRVSIDRSEALAALRHDKKRRGGKLMFVLLKDIGKPYLSEAPKGRELGRAVDLSIRALTK
jgi:3-dehydroquinate synthase